MSDETHNEPSDPTVQEYTPTPTKVVEPETKPYSVFTRREKWIIVAIAATAGFLRYV